MKRFDQIKELIMSLEGDFSKFYDKDNQAAGTAYKATFFILYPMTCACKFGFIHL